MGPDPTPDLGRLGHAVNGALGEGPESQRLAQQRARIVASATSDPPHGARSWTTAVLLATAVAVAVAGSWAIATDSPAPDADRIASWASTPSAAAEALDPASGTWVRAPDDGELHVVPRAGLELTLHPGSAGRIGDQAGRNLLSLETGIVRADVAPGRGIAFSVEAGPYEVRVVGTRFAVAWDATTDVMEVSVERGRVQVHGPGVDDGSGLAVVAGMQLVATADRSEAVLRPIPRPVETAPTNADAAARMQAPAPAKATPRTTATPLETAPTWLALARASRYREAMASVDAIGFDGIVRTADAETLALLAETARLSRDERRAKQVLDVLRRRHADHREGKRATFHLGRIAADADHDFSAAAGWFRAYLEASPADAFAREARGRLMDALYRLGDLGSARSVARDYLERHPEGPHADVAHSLLDR